MSETADQKARALRQEVFEQADVLQDLVVAVKAMLGINNPPAGQPGHIDYGAAVGMASLALAKAEKLLEADS